METRNEEDTYEKCLSIGCRRVMMCMESFHLKMKQRERQIIFCQMPMKIKENINIISYQLWLLFNLLPWIIVRTLPIHLRNEKRARTSNYMSGLYLDCLHWAERILPHQTLVQHNAHYILMFPPLCSSSSFPFALFLFCGFRRSFERPCHLFFCPFPHWRNQPWPLEINQMYDFDHDIQAHWKRKREDSFLQIF